MFQQPELIAKRLDLLMQAVPHIARVVLLYDAAGAEQREAVSKAASVLGVPLDAIELHSPRMTTSKPWRRPMARAVTR
jgi:hypothetical protein